MNDHVNIVIDLEISKWICGSNYKSILGEIPHLHQLIIASNFFLLEEIIKCPIGHVLYPIFGEAFDLHSH